MPELPEVETIVRDLRSLLVGRRIRSARVTWDRTAAPTPSTAALGESARAQHLCLDVAGRRITAVTRRGKHIVLHLDGDRRLIVHLRMTGHLLWEETAPAGLAPLAPLAVRETGVDYVYARSDDDTHTRAVFELDGGRLRFTDTRKFGRMWLVKSDEAEAVLGDLGPEPLADDFSLQDFVARLRSHRGRIKSLLLDQRFLAGLGNIYADEALHRAGIHPLRSAHSLTDEEAARLYSTIRHVLAAGVTNRGTSLGDFSDYLDAQGQPGDHQRYLLVYGRAGQPCVTCGTPIARIVVGGRSTHFCPHCQPGPS